MSIYKPSLLDKFKDFVNGLKSNWDEYEDHVADFDSHQAEFANQLGSNGYQKFPGGIVLQWGQAIVPANVGYVEITLPIEFQTATLNVQTVVIYAQGGGGAQLGKIATPQFAGRSVITIYVREGNAIPSMDLTVSWQAIGY